MILTTHAVVGAALASFVPSHPAVAFVLGFGSHFILDAIPHVDYPIGSRSVNPKFGAPMAFDRALLQDVVTIGSDGLFPGGGALSLQLCDELLGDSVGGGWGDTTRPAPVCFHPVAPRASSDASAFPPVGSLKKAN
jgi:hypothetical protein